MHHSWEVLWNAIRMSRSIFQNPSWKSTCSAPWRGVTMTSYPVGIKTSLSGKSCKTQIQSYYELLSWNLGCSFRFRQKQLRGALTAGGLTMTSYPVGNKTWLSRKLCMAAKMLLWNSWSLFQNPSYKIVFSAPGGELTMATYPGKPGMAAKTLLWIIIMKYWSVFLQNPSWIIARSVPWRRNHDDVLCGLQ